MLSQVALVFLYALFRIYKNALSVSVEAYCITMKTIPEIIAPKVSATIKNNIINDIRFSFN